MQCGTTTKFVVWLPVSLKECYIKFANSKNHVSFPHINQHLAVLSLYIPLHAFQSINFSKCIMQIILIRIMTHTRRTDFGRKINWNKLPLIRVTLFSIYFQVEFKSIFRHWCDQTHSLYTTISLLLAVIEFFQKKNPISLSTVTVSVDFQHSL